MDGNSRDSKEFLVEIIKPSHYDNDGYVIQWFRAFVPSNSLACLYALVQDVEDRKALGEDVRIEVRAYDECHTIIPLRKIIGRIRANAGRGVVFLRASPQLMIALGAAYWKRVDDIVLPYAGVVWTPNDYWEFRLMFPKSRISYFLGNWWGAATWVYGGVEYNVEAYQIDLTSPGGQADDAGGDQGAVNVEDGLVEELGGDHPAADHGPGPLGRRRRNLRAAARGRVDLHRARPDRARGAALRDHDGPADRRRGHARRHLAVELVHGHRRGEPGRPEVVGRERNGPSLRLCGCHHHHRTGPGRRRVARPAV